ncbi:hypothetical protein, partial [Enterobacter sp. AG326]|uniref:hypothetical protein n=1 Tax=Enterobacter sp. AG326 TaxID=2183902 RepID=UPI001AACFB6D
FMRGFSSPVRVTQEGPDGLSRYCPVRVICLEIQLILWVPLCRMLQIMTRRLSLDAYYAAVQVADADPGRDDQALYQPYPGEAF